MTHELQNSDSGFGWSGAERGLVRLVGGMSREYLNLGQLRVVSQSPL